MQYERIVEGKFISRPNRFIAYAQIQGNEETVHVKNTGRCAELLKPQADLFLQVSDNPARKTKWDLIAVRKGERIVNMDSQIPNYAVIEWIEKGNLFQDIRVVRPEVTYKNSRFDLYVETGQQKIFIEIKGVTLENDGVVRFPDAPSERAVKHLRELIKAVSEGYHCIVAFVIAMEGVTEVRPNRATHPEFGQVLEQAVKAGVEVWHLNCAVKEDRLEIISFPEK